MRPLLWTLAILVPGGCLLAVAVYLRKKWIALDQARVSAAIELNKATYRYVEHDEQLRLRTEQRRKAADGLRGRAAHVESGASVSDVLRMVRRNGMDN